MEVKKKVIFGSQDKKTRVKRGFHYAKKSTTKKLIQAIVPLAIAVVFVSFSHKIVINSIKRKIAEREVNRRPEQTELTNYIPDSEEFETINNPLENNDNHLVLSEEAMAATSILINKLNDVYKMYMLTGDISPKFITINYNSNLDPISFKVFCDLNNNKTTFLEYSIAENKIDDFNEIFKSDSLELVNLINGLNKLMPNKNLMDAPAVAPLLIKDDIKYYPTGIQEEREIITDEETGDYTLNEYYAFNLHSADASFIHSNNIKILKSDAEKLDGFTDENLSCLYDLYLQNSDNFLSTISNTKTNNPTLILISSHEQAESTKLPEFIE